MRLTKYVHSCLLVETPKQTILLDPGSYSYDSHLLPLAAMQRLDFIVITHDHPDHFHLPFLKELAAKFPNAVIVTNDQLATKLKDENLRNPISSGSHEGLEVFPAEHEKLAWGLPPTANVGVHIEALLTDPGDSLHIKTTREVLALPLTAPFASIKQSLEAVVKLKPKKVVPLHDWPWQQSARAEYYARSKEYLAGKNIELIEIENAKPVEI